MNKKISKVCFLDAMYITGDEGLSETQTFLTHEAYGYTTHIGNDILVRYIEKIPQNYFLKELKRVLPDRFSYVEMGLIIPNSALVDYQDSHPNPFKDTLTENSTVTVTWRDVTYVENVRFRQSHTMRTKGELYKILPDGILIHNPSTIRTRPFPRKKHVEDAKYLAIPSALITSIRKHD